MFAKIYVILLIVAIIGQPIFSTRILRSSPEAEIIPGQYIVKLKPSVSSKAFVEREVFRTDAGVLSPLKDNVLYVYTTAFNGFAAKLDDTQLRTLDNLQEVEYIERDVVVRADYILENNKPTRETIVQERVTWGIARSSTRDRLTGGGVNDFVWNYRYEEPSGACAVVYVIDTGINIAHVDFGGRAVLGESFIPGTTAVDDNGHGTHCAGTIGGTTYGISKNVALVAVKTLGSNGSSVGSGSSTLAGIDWATANATSSSNQRPTVFSMSFSNVQVNATQDACNLAIDRGITVVAAAGNNNNDACLIAPALTPRAITVAASDINDVRSSFSNYGPCVDIYAPGTSITAPYIGSTTATRTISGTSMATPHIAGLAADLICRFSLQTPAQVDAKLKELATRDAITQNAPLPTDNLMIYYGH